MSGYGPKYHDDYDDPLGAPSIYDGDRAEAAPWFAPESGTRRAAHDAPLPRAQQAAPGAVTAWAVTAQGRHAAQMARAAMAVGRLDGLVAEMGQGALERLALREAEALSWLAGAPISGEEIAQDQLSARAGTDIDGLQTARWAVRRLMGEGPLEDLRGFLGLHRATQAHLPEAAHRRATGSHFDEAAREFLCACEMAGTAHAFVQAAYARHLWHLSDLSPEQDRIEGAVWAARRMAADCAALTFVPMGHAARGLRGTGAAELGRYMRAIEQGAASAGADLMRVRSWAARARERTATIKGGTPARIVATLSARPLCSAGMIEQAAGVSRDTAERALKRLSALGLVREVTGGARYRLWSAAL